MNKLNRLLLLSVLVMTAVLAVGCTGSKDDKDNNEAKTTTGQENSGNETTPEVATGRSDGGMEQTFMMYDGEIYTIYNAGTEEEQNTLDNVLKHFKDTPSDFKLVGSIRERDDFKLPSEEFCASNIDKTSEVYTGDNCVIVKYSDGKTVKCMRKAKTEEYEFLTKK